MGRWGGRMHFHKEQFLFFVLLRSVFFHKISYSPNEFRLVAKGSHEGESGGIFFGIIDLHVSSGRWIIRDE